MLAFVLLAVALAGCASPGMEDESPENNGMGDETQAGTAADIAGENDVAGEGGTNASDGADNGGDSGKAPKKILILGRSVSYGWASFMGLEWQEDESYRGEYGGHDITYREVASPPDIAYSAADAMGEHDSDIVFFKLCFVDFGEGYGDRLGEDKGYVEEVYREAVERRGRRLIVGNALPQVRMHSTEGMERNHEEFNEWLDSFAASHEGISVLDLHGMLADGDGSLNPAYAVAPDDSHLNDAAYAKITPEFFEIVENVT
ncbi:MAG: SGNH/GDSL hydrolase family protein [Candidatus Micrarchaeota archaeon]